MRFQITTLKNKKLIREFANDEAFLGYIEFNNSKIKDIQVLEEEQLPQLQKGVEIAKPTMSKGWGAVPSSVLGSATSSEKSQSVGFAKDKPIATEFRYEPSKPTEKAADDKSNDTVYLDGAKTEQPNVEQKPAEKEVKPEPQKKAEKEDKDSTVDTKEEKSDEKKEKVNEAAEGSNGVEVGKMATLEDHGRKYDVQVLEINGDKVKVKVKSGAGRGLVREFPMSQVKPKGTMDVNVNYRIYLKVDGQEPRVVGFGFDENDTIYRARQIFNKMEGKNKMVYVKELKSGIAIYYITKDGEKIMNESVNESLFGFGAGSKEDLEKALIIAYVKGLEKKTFFGMGLVTKKDLANFDEYKKKYDEYIGDNTEDYDKYMDDNIEDIESYYREVNESMKSYDHSYDDLIGKTIRITNMEGEPQYTGKEGVVEHIDDIGQLHGSWGGLAVQPGTDTFEVIK